MIFFRFRYYYMNYLYLSNKILYWYTHNQRVLPWRNTSDPYKIWISEIILQQTRVDTAINYYNRFISIFPNVFSLANAQTNYVLKAWQGFGYYSRAQNLHKAAIDIVNNYNGVIPNNYTALKKIAGIGDYTAAAIASIAYKQKVAAVDANVYRVLTRIFNIDTPIDTAAGKKQCLTIANELIKNQKPDIFNQAIMEFGALICKPKNALCNACPIHNICGAYKNQNIYKLPVKKQKKAPVKRYFNYLVIEKNQQYAFEKRTQKDIWNNLYQFPLIETNINLTTEKLVKDNVWKNIFSTKKVTISKISEQYVHILSHQKIYVRFIHIELDDKTLRSQFNNIVYSNLNNLQLPIARIIEKYIDKNMLQK